MMRCQFPLKGNALAAVIVLCWAGEYSFAAVLIAEDKMKYPIFFDELKPIVLRDDLAGFLGTFEDGILEISYLDVVKMAGHSCATVAGAWLMAKVGLKELWGEETPRRGEIQVELCGEVDQDANGVVGTVLSNITGAAGNNGFGGLHGRFGRKNLLIYGSEIDTDVRLTRMDTGLGVGLRYRPGKLVQAGAILALALGPAATDESRRTFPHRWQEMVRIILEHPEKVIEIS